MGRKGEEEHRTLVSLVGTLIPLRGPVPHDLVYSNPKAPSPNAITLRIMASTYLREGWKDFQFTEIGSCAKI